MADHASDAHGDYHRGEMDIHEQAATYSAFMKMSKWGSLILAVGLLVLAIWFTTDAGFMAGAITGVVTTVLGVLLLREKPGAGHH